MSVKYRLYQDKRENSTSENKWYARTVYDVSDDLTTSQLCDDIQESTTLTRADVKACIEAFIVNIKRGLLAGRRVKLDGLGTFKVGIKTKGAENLANFTVAGNIKGARVIFMPHSTTYFSGGKRHSLKTMLSGIGFREQRFYDVAKPKKGDDGQGDDVQP